MGNEFQHQEERAPGETCVPDNLLPNQKARGCVDVQHLSFNGWSITILFSASSAHSPLGTPMCFSS